MKSNKDHKMTFKQRLLRFYKDEVKQFNAILGIKESTQKKIC